MTIITKPTQEKKENEENKLKAEFAAVGIDPDQADCEETACNGQPVIGWTESPANWYLAWRRRRLLTSLCAALLVLWLLLAAVIGGILLFRYLHRRPIYYGWCGTSYLDQQREDRYQDAARLAEMQERVEVDPNTGTAKIEVPRFGHNRPSVFVHDFRQNLTAIVDVMGDQCFIKQLDRANVAPPENFIDLLQKMESGYYEQNTAVIREEYRVHLPAMTDGQVKELGSWMISQQCHGKRTFMLEKKYHALERESRRKKRSDCQEFSFMYFNPKDAVHKLSLSTC